ncbi:MAG: hypothetical protein IJV00_08310, partial [Clostridia bacterium]|nr:hypothetical protein [Clostridia bacterium]
MKKLHDMNLTKLLKSVAAFFAALVFVFLSAGAPAEVVASTSSDKTQYNNLVSDKKSLQEKLSKINSDLAKAKSEKASALTQKALLDQQIEALSDLIEVSEQLMAECDGLISSLEQEIDETNSKIDDDLEIIRRRLVFSQEKGAMQYLEFILGSGSISDLLSRVEVMNDLFENDEKILKDLTESKESLESKRDELEQTRQLYASLKEENEQKKEELTVKREEAVSFIEQIENNQSELEKLKNENEAARNQLDAEINALAKKIKEAEEAEKNVRQYSGDFIWPVAVKYNYISQKYKGRSHTGIDIPTNHTPVNVFASAAGKVVIAEYHRSYGNYVVI